MNKRCVAFLIVFIAAATCAAGQDPNAVILPPAKANADLRVSVLSVGAGMCQIIECPGPIAVAVPYIVDCGSTGVGPGMTQAQTTDYIDAILARYSTNPVVVLSHWDKDHHNWISDLFDGVPVSDIWIAGTKANYPQTKTWITKEVNIEHAVLHEGLAPGSYGPMGMCGAYGGVNARALAVTVNTGGVADSNQSSLVWAVQFGNAFAMLMADATGPTQTQARANLLAMGINPPYRLITGSHHGADTDFSNSPAWAGFAQPDAVIFSAGNLYGHPRCTATDVYRQYELNATQHPTRCGVPGVGWRNQNTTKREYVTSVLGNVVVDFNSAGAYSVVCSGWAGCNATASVPGEAKPAPPEN